MHGKGGLSMDGLDRIAECLDLNLTAADKPKTKRKASRIMASISTDRKRQPENLLFGPEPQTQDHLFGRGADEDGANRQGRTSRIWRPRCLADMPRTPRLRSGWGVVMT